MTGSGTGKLGVEDCEVPEEVCSAAPVAALFILGGIAGGAAGALLAGRLAAERGALTRLFAVCVLVVAAFILWKSGHALFA